MILGIDVGNYNTKCCTNKIIINSAISTKEDLLNSKTKLEANGKTYYIGTGNYELLLDKSKKENFMPLLITAILQATDDVVNKVVVGLPISQFKTNEESLKNLILNYNYKNIKLDGEPRELKIKECAVYPECLGAYYLIENATDCIIVDIGGRTTDICFIRKGSIINSSSLAVGTMNVYSDMAEYINSKYTIDIDIEYACRILEREYLKIDGKEVNLEFVKDILKNNFDIINRELELNYPVKSEKIYLIGGGTDLFKLAFKKRYDVEILKDYLFANSKGFQKVGEMMWL